MKLELRPSRWAGLAALALCCAGCGGFQASPSISPATFLLPGLGQVQPGTEPVAEPGPLPPEPEAVAVHAAQVR